MSTYHPKQIICQELLRVALFIKHNLNIRSNTEMIQIHMDIKSCIPLTVIICLDVCDTLVENVSNEAKIKEEECDV